MTFAGDRQRRGGPQKSRTTRNRFNAAGGFISVRDQPDESPVVTASGRGSLCRQAFGRGEWIMVRRLTETDRGEAMNGRRFLGWTMLWASMVAFPMAVGAFCGLTLVGAANLAGMGDEVTVIGTEGPDGDGRAGNGYYVFDGERVQVTVVGLDKGERTKATLAFTTGLGEPGAYAYAEDSEAANDVVWGGILTVVGWLGGWVLYRYGRKLTPRRTEKPRVGSG